MIFFPNFDSALVLVECKIMFYVVGLGLCDEKDITVRGLEVCLLPFTMNDLTYDCSKGQAVKSSTRVYLEAYTSILMVRREKLVSPRLIAYSVASFISKGRVLWKRSDTCR